MDPSQSPHSAFADAEQMAQFAYAAYVRAQEAQRTGASQPNVNASSPIQSDRPIDQSLGHMHSYKTDQLLAWHQQQEYEQAQPRYQQQYQWGYQLQQQPHPNRQLEEQKRLQEIQQNHRDEHKRLQEEDQRRQEEAQRRREVLQRRQEEYRQKQAEQQRLQEEQQRQRKEQQRQKEEQRRQQEEQRHQQEEQRRQQEEQRHQQEEQRRQQEEQRRQQEEQRRQQEEQQRQQIIRNAQWQQYLQSFDRVLPTLGHQSNSSPTRNYATSSATPPQQFAPAPAPAPTPTPALTPMPNAIPNVPWQRSTSDPQKSNFLPNNTGPQANPPREQHTSASRSTIEQTPSARSNSPKSLGYAATGTQISGGNVSHDIPSGDTQGALSRPASVPNGTKRATLPSARQTPTPMPISNPTPASRHTSHSYTGSPNTASPVLPSASTSTASPSVSQTHHPHAVSSAPPQAPVTGVFTVASAQQLPTSQIHHPQAFRPAPAITSFARSQNQPPSSHHGVAHREVSSPRPNPGPLAQYKYATSNLVNVSSVTGLSRPHSTDLQHPTGTSKPAPELSTKPGQVDSRVNSPSVPCNPTYEQAPPSKSRRLNNGAKQNTSTPAVHKFKAGAYVRNSPSQSHLALRPNMIEKMNPADALKKDTYDPATIAHDVLINCAKHPTEKPLNHHMEKIRKIFSEVDYSVDLTTFRWDLVEEAQARVILPIETPRLGSDPVSGYLPGSALRLPPPQPPRLPGPLLVGQAPPPPAQKPTQTPTPAPAPTPPSRPPKLPPLPTVGTIPPVDLRVSRPPSTTSATNHHNPLRALPFQPPTYETRAPSTAPSNLPLGLRPPSEPSRIPVDASLHNSPSHLPPPPPPSKSTSKSTRKQTPQSKSKLASKPKSPSRVTPSEPSTPRSHSSKSHPQPQVVIPPSPIRMASTKRGPGRPKRTVEVAVPAPKPTVQYPVFRCRWGSCQSELHNLKMLESHLMQTHIPYSVTCGWTGCEDTTPKAAADMWQHAQSEHLGPVAWKFGDGPKVPVTADENTPRSHVPSMRNARPSTITLPADNSMVVAFSRVHGNQSLGHVERRAKVMTEGGIQWLDNAGVTLEASSHRISPVLCQPTVNQEELALTN